MRQTESEQSEVLVLPGIDSISPNKHPNQKDSSICIGDDDRYVKAEPFPALSDHFQYNYSKGDESNDLAYRI